MKRAGVTARGTKHASPSVCWLTLQMPTTCRALSKQKPVAMNSVTVFRFCEYFINHLFPFKMCINQKQECGAVLCSVR